MAGDVETERLAEKDEVRGAWRMEMRKQTRGGPGRRNRWELGYAPCAHFLTILLFLPTNLPLQLGSFPWVTWALMPLNKWTPTNFFSK